MTGPQPSNDDLLMDLIKTNRRTDGETMTQEQYKKHGEYNPWQATSKYGTWTKAKTTAGIYKNTSAENTITDKELLKDIKQVKREAEDTVKVKDYKKHGTYSISTIYDRFESFSKARKKAGNI